MLIIEHLVKTREIYTCFRNNLAQYYNILFALENIPQQLVVEGIIFALALHLDLE